MKSFSIQSWRRLCPSRAISAAALAKLIAVPVVLVGVAGLAGCRENFRIDDLTAAELNDPVKRHPIGYSAQTEAMLVEIGGKGEGLSPNQETDVWRFLKSYKTESRGRLTVSVPGGARGHFASTQLVQQVMQMVQGSGIPREALNMDRHAWDNSPEFGAALELSYARPVAVAPQCGNWPEDLGRDRERISFENHGCATRRNLALTVANSRDLQMPQQLSPRSSERRSVTWTKYVDAGGSGAPPPAPANTPQPGGKQPGMQP